MNLRLKTQAQKARQYVFFTNQFGFDMFIADPKKSNIPVTDTEDEALEFSEGFDNKTIKKGYYEALTGYNLQIKILS